MRTRLPAALILATTVVTAVAACSSGGTAASPATSESPSGAPASAEPTPAATPAATPATGAITHPTGADEIILRFDESGGFVPPEFLAAHIPQFTLYGDGTAVFVDASATPPTNAENIFIGQPVRAVTLTEDEIQALLVYAIRDGALGIAKPQYTDMLIADAPTATFTLNADGASKTVAVYALGMDDPQPNADTPVKKQLAELGTRLRDFGAGGAKGDPYVPAAFRGVLTEQQGIEGVTTRPWPWTDVKATDFVLPADANALPQGTATLTKAQVDALAIDGAENGIASGLYLEDGGKVYSLVIRPLLPDETK